MAKSSGKIKETPLQMGMVDLLRLDFLPEDLLFTSTANGAVLPTRINTRTGQRYSPEGRKLKRMGLLAGITDFLFWWAIVIEENGVQTLWMDCGFIEVKTKDGVLSDDQIEVRRRVKAMGGKHAVVRTYEQLRDQLIAWGAKCQHRVHL